MKNPLLTIKILNLFNGLLITTYLFKVMNWYDVFKMVSVTYFIIAAFAAYGIRSWIELKYDIINPIKTNPISKIIYNIGAAFFIVGLLFKLMHWPFAGLSLIGGTALINTGLMITLISDDDHSQPNDSEILDQY